MAGMSVRIDGLSEMLGRFGDAKGTVLDAFEVAMTKAGIFIEGESKPITPIDTGVLHNATHSKVRRFGDFIQGVVYNRTPYALKIHDGTPEYPLSKSPKNPNTVRQFFQVVLDRDGGRVLDPFWEEASKKVIDHLAK